MAKLVSEEQVKELTDVMIEAVDELGSKISITQGGIQGAVTPTSIAPTAKGMYPVAEPGVYANFKDSNNQPISITQEDFESGIVFIVFSGTSSAKVITPVPANGEAKEGDRRAISGEGVYESTLVKEVFLLKQNSINLANPSEIKEHTHFSPATKKINYTLAGRWGIWLYLPVGNYYVQGRGNRSEVAFFTKKNSVDECVSFVSSNSFSVTNNAQWVFINITFDDDITPYLTTLMVSEGNSSKPYVPFNVTYGKIKPEFLSSISTSNNEISDIAQNGVALYENVIGKNKIDKTKIIADKYFSPGSNKMVDVSEDVGWRGVWVYEGFNTNDQYIVGGRDNRLEVAFFGTDRVVPISYVQKDSFNVPIGTQAIFINITNKGVDTHDSTVMMYLSSDGPKYEPYSSRIMLKKSLTQIKDIKPASINDNLIIPSKMYIGGGNQINIYKDALSFKSYETDIIGAVGNTFLRNYQYTPSPDLNSNFNIDFDIYENSEIVNSKTVNIERRSSNNGSGITRKLLLIGASKSTHVPKHLSDLFEVDSMNLEFIGTKLDNGVKHEAVSGWSYKMFSTSGSDSYVFRFNQTGINVPNLQDEIEVGENRFIVSEVNYDSETGIGHITSNLISGSNSVPTQGTINNITQSNTVNYINSSLNGGNPFFNPSTNSFDLGYYLTSTNQSLNDNDWIVIELGTNDLFSTSGSTTFDAKFSECVQNMNSIIDAIHRYNPNVRIGISTIANFGNQDAFGITYNSSYSFRRFRNNGWFKFNKKILELFDDEKVNDIYVVNQHCTIDSLHSVKIKDIQVNEFDTNLTTIQQDPLHLTENGYKQMARTIFHLIKCKG